MGHVVGCAGTKQEHKADAIGYERQFPGGAIPSEDDQDNGPHHGGEGGEKVRQSIHGFAELLKHQASFMAYGDFG